MKRKFYIIFFIFILLIGGCKKSDSKIEGKIKIVTTIFPLYDFVREIGKDRVEVSLILPPGVEAHSFEPTPENIIKINESDIFIYIGESMEVWVDKIIKSLKNDKIKILEVESFVELYKEEDSHHHNEKEEHNHHGKDPHIWLDFEIDKKIVAKIGETLAQIDPKNKDFYLGNVKNYNTKLDNLDKKYRETIEKCELKTIMYGGHFAFGYLARRYGLTHISPYSGFTPNSEPTPQKILELIDNIKKNKIEYIFYEELLEPKVAKAISQTINVKFELLHGAHNLTKDEFEKGITFLSIMEDNLEKLKKGLKYKEK